MNKELIEKLKNNWTAWAGLTEKEKDFFKKVPIKNRLRLDLAGNWVSFKITKTFSNCVLRISPDYQSEPEFSDAEIISNSYWLGIDNPKLKGDFIPLNKIPAMPNFVQIFRNRDDGTKHIMTIDEVAEWVRVQVKVYARFRR